MWDGRGGNLREADAEGEDDDDFEAEGHVEAGDEVDGIKENEKLREDVEESNDEPAPRLPRWLVLVSKVSPSVSLTIFPQTSRPCVKKATGLQLIEVRTKDVTVQMAHTAIVIYASIACFLPAVRRRYKRRTTHLERNKVKR